MSTTVPFTTSALLFVWLVLGLSTATNPCIERKYSGADSNIVCVCNATYCDEIEPLEPLQQGQAAVYLSTSGGARLQKQIVAFESNKPRGNVTIRIDVSTRFQTILGFGGAFTDSVGINLEKLSSANRHQLLSQYYGENGIGYTVGRVPIASTDFSLHEYSYADTANDFELHNFRLTSEDFLYKIPYIAAALNMTAGQLNLFASPWSAPGWMKTSGRMKGPGSLRGSVNSSYAKTYARYFERFFEEYARHDIEFWGVTTQNEPSSGLVPFYPWQTMYFSGYEQQQFIKYHLGPVLRSNNVTSQLKIMVNDDNVFMLPSYPKKILEDPVAASYVDGVGVHWYSSDLLGRDRILKQHEQMPDKFILSTEACNGYEPFNHGPRLGSWDRGDRYARDIIAVLQRFTVGWVDWNLCLDEQGGPTWVQNFVDAPIITNATADEFYKQPMFYALAHFSKFVLPGSVRVMHTVSELPYDNRLDAVAFVTATNRRVLVALNSHKEHTYELTVQEPSQQGTLTYNLPPQSIATFVWDK